MLLMVTAVESQGDQNIKLMAFVEHHKKCLQATRKHLSVILTNYTLMISNSEKQRVHFYVQNHVLNLSS